jgi:hypothetical protein
MRLSQLGYDVTSSAQDWIPKMVMGAHKKQRIASALTFLERYHKDDDFSVTSYE